MTLPGTQSGKRSAGQIEIVRLAGPRAVKKTCPGLEANWRIGGFAALYGVELRVTAAQPRLKQWLPLH